MKRSILLCVAALTCAVLLGATPFKKAASAMKLPPGMTPAIFKMMMTPLKGHPAAMPAGTVPLDGCIPTMGYHYANPKNWPLGPVYGYYNGKAIFTEAMIDQRSFARGRSWDEILKPLPGYKIDHVDVWYEAHGHPGYTIPHYDIHAWYIPRSQYMYFCGNKSGKKPSFL
jgi:hypothetical protein